MSFLEKILEDKREKNKYRSSESQLLAEIDKHQRSAIRRPSFDSNKLNVIAEIKRSSPSKGKLAKIDFPEKLAESYQSGGANIISVLTNEEHFDARGDDLEKVRNSVDIPVLRKDFMVDVGDIFETYLMQADLVLLIVSAFSDVGLLREMYTTTKELGLDGLVEVHNEEEIEIANELNADIIGVNVRDLQSFKEKPELGEKLLNKVNEHAIKVWESSISSIDDAQRAYNSSANAVLVGQALVQHSKPDQFIREMRNIG